MVQFERSDIFFDRTPSMLIHYSFLLMTHLFFTAIWAGDKRKNGKGFSIYVMDTGGTSPTSRLINQSLCRRSSETTSWLVARLAPDEKKE